MNSVFPWIVSAETILFWNVWIMANSNSCRKFTYLRHFFLRKLLKETILGPKIRKYDNCSYKTKLHLFIYKIMITAIVSKLNKYPWKHVKWKVFGIVLTVQRVYTSSFEGTTSQANSSCFYFRILCVLMERLCFFKLI